jgi:hypothetical protein
MLPRLLLALATLDGVTERSVSLAAVVRVVHTCHAHFFRRFAVSYDHPTITPHLGDETGFVNSWICPHCNALHEDTFEVFDIEVSYEIRCCGCAQIFSILTRECLLCAHEWAVTSDANALPNQSARIAKQSCPSCQRSPPRLPEEDPA